MAVLHKRTKSTTKAVQREIADQMKDMPLEWLLSLRDYAMLLHKQTLHTQPTPAMPEREPTLDMPATSLLGLIAIMPPIGGAALADTEALYDQV